MKERDELHFAVSRLDTLENRERYLSGDFPQSELVNDLWKRYRWDLYWASGYRFEPGKYLDAHIDTALRSVVANFD